MLTCYSAQLCLSWRKMASFVHLAAAVGLPSHVTVKMDLNKIGPTTRLLLLLLPFFCASGVDEFSLF